MKVAFTLALGIAMAPMTHAQEEPRYMPGKFEVSFIPTPNFNPRPAGTVVDTIVLHHTAGSTTASCVKWFETTESQVSAHYVIGKDGSIIQMVNTFYRAWHAGNSVDLYGRKGLNDFSVGIEIVNKGDGIEPYPPVQVEAVRLLVGYLCRHHFRGQIRQILSHEIIAVPPGRKNDPINYPWDSIRDVATEFKVRLGYGRTDRSPMIDPEPTR